MYVCSNFSQCFGGAESLLFSFHILVNDDNLIIMKDICASLLRPKRSTFRPKMASSSYAQYIEMESESEAEDEAAAGGKLRERPKNRGKKMEKNEEEAFLFIAPCKKNSMYSLYSKV